MGLQWCGLFVAPPLSRFLSMVCGRALLYVLVCSSLCALGCSTRTGVVDEKPPADVVTRAVWLYDNVLRLDVTCIYKPGTIHFGPCGWRSTSYQASISALIIGNRYYMDDNGVRIAIEPAKLYFFGDMDDATMKGLSGEMVVEIKGGTFIATVSMYGDKLTEMSNGRYSGIIDGSRSRGESPWRKDGSEVEAVRTLPPLNKVD